MNFAHVASVWRPKFASLPETRPRGSKFFADLAKIPPESAQNWPIAQKIGRAAPKFKRPGRKISAKIPKFAILPKTRPRGSKFFADLAKILPLAAKN
ncbi:MAG: hypothetical protein K6U09_12575 [Acidobacteriia bacterium]|nr:hypothetical protein [Terriglobia bacterium]